VTRPAPRRPARAPSPSGPPSVARAVSRGGPGRALSHGRLEDPDKISLLTHTFINTTALQPPRGGNIVNVSATHATRARRRSGSRRGMEFIDMLGAGGVGAEIKLGGDSGAPLWWAARRVRSTTTSILVGAGALRLATLLLRKGADVDAAGTDADGNASTPLWWAARAVWIGAASGQEELERGGQELELATLLVKKHADVNAVGSYAGGYKCAPLWWATRAVRSGKAGGLELATLLVKKGADVNAVGRDGVGNGSAPLWLAARAVHNGEAGGAELPKLLVKKGADVNAVGTEGGGKERPECAPLWWAARAVWRGEAGGLEMATLLVKKGADVSTVGTYWDGKKHSPLRWAALAVSHGEADGLELAKILVKTGADVNTVGADEDGIEGTPLRWAAAAVRASKAGAPKLARLLISAGARLADSERDEFQGIVDGV